MHFTSPAGFASAAIGGYLPFGVAANASVGFGGQSSLRAGQATAPSTPELPTTVLSTATPMRAPAIEQHGKGSVRPATEFFSSAWREPRQTFSPDRDHTPSPTSRQLQVATAAVARPALGPERLDSGPTALPRRQVRPGGSQRPIRLFAIPVSVKAFS